MKKVKQILAIIAVVLLVGMYISTLVFAVQKNENAAAWFRASIACTILVPVFLYAFFLIARTLRPSKSPLIDAVIFDVGKVLLDFPWETYAEKLDLSPEAIDAIQKNVMNSKLWSEFDRNNRPYEDIVGDFCRICPAYKKEIHEVVDTIDRCIEPFPYTAEWLSELKGKGYKLYVLSNWSEQTYNRLKSRGVMDFEKYMDGAVWSFRHHVIKPDKAIFDVLTKNYGLVPERSVFIDDISANIEGAKRCGFNAIQFKDYQDARAKLAALGVK